jgi:hypothetical protein
MDGQVRLNGLNLNEPRKLTPPSQLLAQTQTEQTQPEVADLPEVEQSSNKSELQNSDQKNISNIASSAVAGVMGISSVVKDLGTIGESMRAIHVQNSMSEIQDRSYSDNGYGSRSYGRNDYGYDADYGATEFVRRRGQGRIEFSPDRRFGRIESEGIRSPELRMAATNIAKGTFQGAKYGVIIGGAVSSVVNAYKVLTGKEKGSDAVGVVAADTVTAGVSGATGALTGGLASVTLASIGLAGPVGMAFAVGIGAAGAIGGQMLMTKTGLYDSIKEKVKGMLAK